jgi:hypothetical protein
VADADELFFLAVDLGGAGHWADAIEVQMGRVLDASSELERNATPAGHHRLTRRVRHRARPGGGRRGGRVLNRQSLAPAALAAASVNWTRRWSNSFLAVLTRCR